MSTITRLPADLPARIRTTAKALQIDVDVVELPGWRDRGRPASTGTFRPVGGLWHHTGGSPDTPAYVDWMTLEGRPDLPAPLCQTAVGRRGVIYLCAAGRANHAGVARAAGTVAAGDGNSLYWGTECLNTGSEGWSPAQYGAMVVLGVVKMDVLGTSAQAQRMHRETSTTGKWDPGMLDADDFRRDLARAHARLHAKPDPEPQPFPLAARGLVELDDLQRALDRMRTKGAPKVRQLVDEDLQRQLQQLRRGIRSLVDDDEG
ncbi:hypothetical protein GCM10023340_08640 [Nocardioides marinquilinus]|uniref:N-acetylmuramoyl-L-alanine amidase domain-containing protein n=1 Tax=Nocardioides marinquilinus TaxID=1210400 RepID=A0ABP9PAG1_9ACTN